jgi:DNA polymerase-3 subunit delta'
MTPAVSVVHVPVVERFRRLIANGRLGHAYLFSGPPGIGKFDTALAVAKLFNCDKGALPECDCASCRKIGGLAHPDLLIVEHPEDKAEILVGQIIHRDNEPYDPILPKLALRPFEARRRVVIIKEAGMITDAAVSALLKTLEEPHADTYFILTTSQPRDVKPTIVSRCQQVFFFPPSFAALAEGLENGSDVPLSQANALARFSVDSPRRVMEKGAGFIDEKNRLIDMFIFGAPDDKVLKALADDKDEARLLLEVVITFYRDIWLFKLGVPVETLAHADRAADLARQAGRYRSTEIEAIIRQASRAMQSISENFNVKVVLTLLKEIL